MDRKKPVDAPESIGPHRVEEVLGEGGIRGREAPASAGEPRATPQARKSTVEVSRSIVFAVPFLTLAIGVTLGVLLRVEDLQQLEAFEDRGAAQETPRVQAHPRALQEIEQEARPSPEPLPEKLPRPREKSTVERATVERAATGRATPAVEAAHAELASMDALSSELDRLLEDTHQIISKHPKESPIASEAMRLMADLANERASAHPDAKRVQSLRERVLRLAKK